MKLTTRKLGDWKILTPGEARLDAYISEGFKKALSEAIADGTKSLILDLSDVEFMDSSGLGALVFCRQRLPEGGQIVIAGAQQEVVTLMRLTHLDKVFLLTEAPEDVLEQAR
jgi:anti-sigma B factor antagonist